MRKDAPSAAIEQELRDMRLWGLSTVMTRLIFRFGLLRAAYTRPALESVVQRSRFGQCEIAAAGLMFQLRLVKPTSTGAPSSAQTVLLAGR
jgi:hypothetical protein